MSEEKQKCVGCGFEFGITVGWTLPYLCPKCHARNPNIRAKQLLVTPCPPNPLFAKKFGDGEPCPKCESALEHDAELRKPRCPHCGPIWIRLDQTMIAVIDMDVEHLTNTIEMLKRKAAPRLERNGYDPETDTHRIFPIIVVMEAEIDRQLQRQQGLEEIGGE